MTDPTATASTPDPQRTLASDPSPGGLLGSYRPASNPVLLLDPRGSTVDWSKLSHVEAFASALASGGGAAVAGSDLGRAIHDFAQEYEHRDPDHTPTDAERAMLEDFGNALMERLSPALNSPGSAGREEVGEALTTADLDALIAPSRAFLGPGQGDPAPDRSGSAGREEAAEVEGLIRAYDRATTKRAVDDALGRTWAQRQENDAAEKVALDALRSAIATKDQEIAALRADRGARRDGVAVAQALPRMTGDNFERWEVSKSVLEEISDEAADDCGYSDAVLEEVEAIALATERRILGRARLADETGRA